MHSLLCLDHLDQSSTHLLASVSPKGLTTKKPFSSSDCVPEQIDGDARLIPVSAHCIFSIVTPSSTHYVMVADRATANKPGPWRFVACHLSPGELPLQAACTALIEQIEITSRGSPVSFADVAIGISGKSCSWVTEDGIESFRARSVLYDHQIHFYYPMALNLTEAEGIKVKDNLCLGRGIRLFMASEVEAMAKMGKMDGVSARMWELSKAQ